MSRYEWRLTPQNASGQPRWRDVGLFYLLVAIVGSVAILAF